MSSSRNILIYRLGSLGDTVIMLPCFHRIRQVYPDSRIYVLTNQPVSGKAPPVMAILENSGLCDEAISYPVGTRNTRELAAVRQSIRRLQPQVLFNLAAGRGRLKSLRDYLFFRSCGIKHIVGMPWRKRDLSIQLMTDGTYEPESQRLAARLASLGEINLADRQLWDLKLTPTEQKRAAELLPANHENFIAVSVGTKLPSRDWGQENWETLLTLLSREMPASTLLLLGAADEADRSERLSRSWAGRSINFCGKVSPRVSAAIMEHCRLFIGHDSGPMHLASAVGVPTLGLFSWHNPPGQWFPGHRSWKFIKILYPALPPGGWNVGLQATQNGVRMHQPEVVAKSAVELWRNNLQDSKGAPPAESKNQ